jgi:serine phosphatase RsbU (regulator of sigma subunit)
MTPHSKGRRKPKSPPNPGRDFLHTLWMQPLVAIPLALFFGTLFGAGWRHYREAYTISVVFSYFVGFAVWGVTHLILPRIQLSSEGTRSTFQHSMIYTGASLIATIAAALFIHFFVMQEFLGNAQSIVSVAMFSLLFSIMALGISLAIAFYRKAITQAKSEQELNLARRIQRSFLISQFPEMPRLEVHAVNVSSKEVSGDFYDVVPAGERAFLLAIADVAGKGVPAALLSSMLQASLRTQAHTHASVATILENINTLVYRSTAVNQFATFFLARVEEDAMRITFSNAGHNFPIVFRRDGSRLTLERGGTVVGILESVRFEEDTVELQPGDRIVLYTDGINEAEDPAGELFGDERLTALIAALPHELSAREVTERILEGVREHLAGLEAGDDMTVLVLRVLEPRPSRDGAAAPEALRTTTAPTTGQPA